MLKDGLSDGLWDVSALCHGHVTTRFSDAAKMSAPISTVRLPASPPYPCRVFVLPRIRYCTCTQSVAHNTVELFPHPREHRLVVQETASRHTYRGIQPLPRIMDAVARLHGLRAVGTV